MAGSETRKRQKLIQVRVNDEERAAICERAESFDIPASSFLRILGVHGRSPRLPVRQPLTAEDRQQLARLLAAVGRLGGNVNQIARALHRGRTPYAEEFEATLADLVEFRRELRGLLQGIQSRDC